MKHYSNVPTWNIKQLHRNNSIELLYYAVKKKKEETGYVLLMA